MMYEHDWMQHGVMHQPQLRTVASVITTGEAGGGGGTAGKVGQIETEQDKLHHYMQSTKQATNLHVLSHAMCNAAQSSSVAPFSETGQSAACPC